MNKIGPIFEASHVSMRDDFEISIPELDLAVETALKTGAIASRMTGGGFGGAAIAVINKDLLPSLETAVTAAFARSRVWPTKRIYGLRERRSNQRKLICFVDGSYFDSLIDHVIDRIFSGVLRNPSREAGNDPDC